MFRGVHVFAALAAWWVLGASADGLLADAPADAQQQSCTNPAKANPDFAMQGESLGQSKNGNKVKDAAMTVRLHGIEIHPDVTLPHATTAAPEAESPAPGPIFLQNHGNPVRFRYIWVMQKTAATESLVREGRAVWNHSGTGAFVGDWERSAKLLADNGFNMVLPNMLWGGLAHYASDVLPRSATFDQHGDQIEQCCKAAKRHGLEVHVWKVNYNLQGAPKEFVERMRREGRIQIAVSGKPIDWLCPSHPENQKLERESMIEVARKYPVDGLHFDYIRYPGREFCYCEGCRRRFAEATGRKVADADWPRACSSGPLRDEYNRWRCDQITALVAAVRREAKQVRSELKISAAVFGSYPDCRESVAQDWPKWIEAGLLDFVCPMDYSADDAQFVALVRKQMRLIGGRTPLYAGIGATATGIHLTPERVAGQIESARSLGAAGFSIFNFDAGTAASLIPGVGRAACAQKAVPPHCSPQPLGDGRG